MALNDNDYLVGAGELEQRLDDPDLRILDCRFSLLDPQAGLQAYERSHIPGAVYADLDRDLSGPVGAETGRHPLPAPETICATFGRFGIDSGTTVALYDDRSGAIAARAWWLLRWLGHEKAMLLDGGFAAWKKLGLPLESGQVSVAKRRFRGVPQAGLVIDTSEIATGGVADAPFLLIDARSRERFLGEEEPIDSVAGHIPGASNLPFDENLDGEGRFREPDDIEENLRTLLGDDRSRPWAVMCGSGVTACHLVIAALVAGYGEPRVYVGSWSEWIRDGERRVATGPGTAAEPA